MLLKESNVTINVKDMDKSVAFYKSIGFEEKNRWGNYYAQLTAPGITIGLHPSDKLENGSGNVSIGFTTDNFEEAKSLLTNLAVNYESRGEEGGNFLHFSDPDGTALYFVKPKW